MANIRKNLFYNIVRIGLKMSLPILILPLITSKLGVENIGLIEYGITTVTYFILFASLGIPTFGAREVSVKKSSKSGLTLIMCELYIILFTTTILSFVFYELFVFITPSFSSNRLLYVVLGGQVLCAPSISGEWVFEGLENQKYLTLRYAVIQILFVIGVFLLVKEETDSLLYVLCLVFVSIANFIINIANILKIISFKSIKFCQLFPLKHVKHIGITFMAQVSSLIYTQSAITILGLFTNLTSVGYYSVSVKFFRLSTAFWPALSGSFIPRLTLLWNKKQVNAYNILCNRILGYSILFSAYISVCMFSLSDQIILLFAGEKFLNSILILKVLSFGIIGSVFSYFLGIIVLYSKRKDRYFLQISIIVAIVNIVLNLMFVNRVTCSGIALITSLSEYICCILLICKFKKEYEGINIISFDFFKVICCAIITAYIITLIPFNFESILVQFIIKLFLISIFYFSFLILFRISYVKYILKDAKVF